MRLRHKLYSSLDKMEVTKLNYTNSSQYGVANKENWPGSWSIDDGQET